MKLWPTLGLKLRGKLLLVSLVLLLLPWLGVRYIQAVEGLLQQQQAQAMATIAKATSVLLSQHAEVFSHRRSSSEKHSRALKTRVTNITSSVQIDGYQDEWLAYKSRRQSFASVNQLSNNKLDPQDVSARYILVKKNNSLSILLDVLDDSIVFRDPSKQQRHGGDAIVLAMVDAKEQVHRYILSASTFGRVNAYEYFGSYLDPVIIQRQSAIKAAWQRSSFGYRLELSFPLTMVNQSLSLAVIDIDNNKQAINVLGLGDVRDRDQFTQLLLPSDTLANVMKPMATDGVRLWLVDDQGISMAAAGQGDVMIAEPEVNSFADLFYQLFLKQIVSDDESLSHEEAVLSGETVKSALSGLAKTERRQTINGGHVMIVAAQPVIVNGDIVGAIVAEQNTNAILGLQNQAVKALLKTMILAFVSMVVVLIGFATWLSFRIKRLNRDVSSMVSGDGRVDGRFEHSIEHDELGELRQSFRQIFDRLTRYTDYLEALASRLTHELRTPIAVIRTSLEHLEQKPNDGQVYIDRARTGSERLNNIVARMSEATRLEQSINKEVLHEFDLQQLLKNILPVYQDLHPDVQFDTDIGEQALIIKGSQDLIVQMLDKLVGNAIDFHEVGTPITISLKSIESSLQLMVKNSGTSLAEDEQQQLFQPMVSIRSTTSQDSVPHLGLGLYIVKLVVDKHAGKVIARNWQDGVEFYVELPITSL